MIINKFAKILILILIFSKLLLAGELTEKAKEIIIQNYSKSTEIISYKLNLDTSLKNKSEIFAQQRFFSNFVYYYEIKENNNIIGYAILDNVLGKVKPITYLVIFNDNFSVKSVNVVKYREQYGGAIENYEWLNQFNQKTISSEIELGKSIDGISGATISVKAMIKGVKRLLYLINNLGEDERDLLVSIE